MDPSHDDKTTCPRILAVTKAPQDLTRSERQTGKRGRRRGEGPSVATRVGDGQEDVVRATVANLQGELALEGLDVSHDGLGLHRQPPAAPADHPVPASKVAVTGQRDLGRPAEIRMQVAAQSLE